MISIPLSSLASLVGLYFLGDTLNTITWRIGAGAVRAAASTDSSQILF